MYNISTELGALLTDLQATLSANSGALFGLAGFFIGLNFVVNLVMAWMPWNRRNSEDKKDA